MNRRIRSTFLVVAIAAIVLAGLAGPAGATTPVTKAQRELVILSSDLSQGGAVERALYDVVEMGGVGLGLTALRDRYRTVYVLSGSAATQAGFINRLDQETARAGVQAVDVIFMTHGLTGEVSFSTGPGVTVTTVANTIIANLTTAQRARLRMLFSTACFGSSHRSEWRRAGFKMASGARGVYADSAASYPAFLTSWTATASFGTSIATANAAGLVSGWDQIASGWAWGLGYWWWDEVNSQRRTSGSTGLTIDTMP